MSRNILKYTIIILNTNSKIRKKIQSEQTLNGFELAMYFIRVMLINNNMTEPVPQIITRGS